MLIKTPGLKWTQLSYYLIRDWRERRLLIVGAQSPYWGLAYNFGALLNSQYIFYPVTSPTARGHSPYRTATLKFLRSPPTAFAEAHKTVAYFDLAAGEKAKLIKRVKPLTSKEAEISIAALELPDVHKSRKYAVLAPLYAAEGDLEEALTPYDQVPDARPRARAPRHERAGQGEGAGVQVDAE